MHMELSKALFEIEDLKARLATVEAERDAARAASEKDREWLSRALEKQAEYLGQSQMLVAERDAAFAGEARAVELCVKASKVIRWCLESITRIDPIGGMEGFPDEFGGVGYDCEVIGESSSALAWLAQQRAEAAKQELDGLYKRWEDNDDYEADGGGLCQCIDDRIKELAALRAGATGGQS